MGAMQVSPWAEIPKAPERSELNGRRGLIQRTFGNRRRIVGFIAVFAACYAAGAAALQLQNAGKPRDKAMPAPWETTSRFSALKQNSY